MIEVKNISKTFDNISVLDDINFTLNEGEIAVLIGENGAGKSTLMRIISGYISASYGEVRIFGKDIVSQRLEALSYIGYVPEISLLYSEMTVYDFLYWIAKIHNVTDIEKKIYDVSKQLQITDVLTKKNQTLSKGYKKRVEIASALLFCPKFLILDEPTDGLDPNQKQEIRSLILNYAKNNIVLISTHVLEDADIAKRVIMLSKGKLILDASLAQFKKISKTKDMREAFHILSHKEKL